MCIPKYCYPGDLFAEPEALARQIWTCVRTRPRWEKKFSRWLAARDVPHFLPLYEKRTVSYRKVRLTEMPLFPGYVFVLGRRTKADFATSDSVAYLVAPGCREEEIRLACDILSIREMLCLGNHPILVQEWKPGQRVRVVAGPLAGVHGEISGDGQRGKLVVWVEFLGQGLSVELPEESLVEPEE